MTKGWLVAQRIHTKARLMVHTPVMPDGTPPPPGGGNAVVTGGGMAENPSGNHPLLCRDDDDGLFIAFLKRQYKKAAEAVDTVFKRRYNPEYLQHLKSQEALKASAKASSAVVGDDAPVASITTFLFYNESFQETIQELMGYVVPLVGIAMPVCGAVGMGLKAKHTMTNSVLLVKSHFSIADYNTLNQKPVWFLYKYCNFFILVNNLTNLTENYSMYTVKDNRISGYEFHPESFGDM
jgi:hypothetical protein